MHVRTSESEIREVFDRFGKIEEIIMVKDSKTRGFRGYCFIYYKHEREATAALNECNGMELKERIIRVDYSLSARPHSPTPGRNFGISSSSFTCKISFNFSFFDLQALIMEIAVVGVVVL
jgi:transformer-2 protein